MSDFHATYPDYATTAFGLASDLGDLDRFLDFAERTYRDADPDRSGLAPRLHC